MTTKSNTRKTILLVTTSRSDFATLRPLLLMLKKDKQLRPLLFVTGDHFSKKAGETYKQIKASGIAIDAAYRVKQTQPALMVGEVVTAVAKLLKKESVSYALVCGDRKETFAAAIACALSQVPLFHIHGGDVSYGMVDDAMRHATTKLSAVHFPASPLSARRLKQMGEESWRVYMTGSPDVDDLSGPLPERETLKALGLKKKEYALLLLNPETLLDVSGNKALAHAACQALKRTYKGKVVVVYPNNDPSSGGIRSVYEGLRGGQFVICKAGLPRKEYLAVLKNAEFLAGNSSSGITEAATFRTPVINMGRRQDGREQSKNVLNVKAQVRAIETAIVHSQSASFQRSLKNVKNVYGMGSATQKIYKAMQTVMSRYDTRALLYKKFQLR